MGGPKQIKQSKKPAFGKKAAAKPSPASAKAGAGKAASAKAGAGKAAAVKSVSRPPAKAGAGKAAAVKSVPRQPAKAASAERKGAAPKSEAPRARGESGGRPRGAELPSSLENRLKVRQIRLRDIRAVQELQRKCFPNIEPWAPEQLARQLEVFPEGQMCVILDDKLVATSSSLIVNEDAFSGPHTLKDVSDDGMLGTHDPHGDMLYGIDIAVDPEHRGLRLARRLYDARKAVIKKYNLRGMLIAGRIPNYHKHAKTLTALNYVEAVLDKELRDPVLTAQLANGFVIHAVLADYFPSDLESKGYAVLMEWPNPSYMPRHQAAVPSRYVRVASVQYQMRTVKSFEEFATQCEFFIDTAGEYRCDFVLFPELITNQLLALVPADRPGLSARRLQEFTEDYLAFFSDMAIKYDINIIGGTHLTVEDDVLYNIAYLFRRDGSVEKQYKLHITPAEARWWGVSPGHKLHVFDTDRGKIAILICYDSEFPELARIARAKGANILFIPFNTDVRSGYLRVRSCSAARCIENHVYAVLSGAVGNLPFVEGADIHYAQSCILTPSDISFARDGIASEATPNVEVMVMHDLDIEVLQRTMRTGAVRPWGDRRLDLYQVRHNMHGEDEHI